MDSRVSVFFEKVFRVEAVVQGLSGLPSYFRTDFDSKQHRKAKYKEKRVKMHSIVKVHSLKDNLELNGLAGEIVEVDRYSGRFSVSLENGHYMILFEDNLELIDQDRCATSSGEGRGPVQQSE